MRRFGIAAALAAALASLAAGSAGAAPLDALVTSQLARAGGVSGGYVVDLSSGRTLASVRADVARNPASVEKLYTGTTALLRFGPDATLATTVLGSGTLDDAGTWHGDLYLRGEGDPTFGSATFDRRAYGTGATVQALAAALRAAGIVRVTGAVYGDESWLDQLRGDPANGYALDLTDIGGPLGGLLFDRGLAKEDGSAIQTAPATFAAQQLAGALHHLGVAVNVHRVGARTTPADAHQLAAVSSPSIAALVRLTLVPSDNMLAEMLIKDIGAKFAGAGATAAGAAIVKRTIGRFGIRPEIVDGSGLSRADRSSPHQVVTLLAAMRGTPGFRAALPVAGRTGTLADRMRRSSAQDRCQAKTGTLSNASALAGFCRTPNGHLLAFAFIENHVHTPRAKAIEDGLAIRLARTRPAAQAPPTAPLSPSPPSTPGGASPASSASSPASSSTGTPSR
jgi:serine-type D-Ala-D-Ala carboxypeptidase/endopeptidase (penicillin-binding protein 4)